MADYPNLNNLQIDPSIDNQWQFNNVHGNYRQFNTSVDKNIAPENTENQYTPSINASTVNHIAPINAENQYTPWIHTPGPVDRYHACSDQVHAHGKSSFNFSVGKKNFVN